MAPPPLPPPPLLDYEPSEPVPAGVWWRNFAVSFAVGATLGAGLIWLLVEILIRYVN